MKKTKKAVLSLIMVTAIFLATVITSFAAGGITVSLTPDNDKVENGQFVEITVAVPDYAQAKQFIGLSGAVEYDSSSLELVGTRIAAGIDGENITLNKLNGKVVMLYFNNDAFTDENPVELTGNGDVITFIFKTLKAGTSTQVTFKGYEAATIDGDVVDTSASISEKAAVISITGGASGEETTEPSTDAAGNGQGAGTQNGDNPKMGDPFVKSLMIAAAALVISGLAIALIICKRKGLSMKDLFKAIRKVFTRRTVKTALAFALVFGIISQCGGMLITDAKITEQKFYTYSDANGDGVVDNTDRDLIRQAIVEMDVISEDNFDAADAYTADGKDAITIMDLVIALQRIDGVIYDVGESVYSQPSDVYYEVFVRAFCDSDGDGIGDLRGLASKIPYLASLGITGIWMMPINENNSSHGYDTIDYYSVEQDYGTMEDLNYLSEVAHENGIDLVMDLVINHCSTSNKWFVEALKGEYLEDGTENPYYDYFYFLPPDANFVDKTDLEIQNEKKAYLEEHGSLDGWVEQYPKQDCATDNNATANEGATKGAWRQVNNSESPLNGYYYMAIFGGMVDLNLSNPDVRKECIDIANYWLDNGMDGFRLDACRHIFGKYYSTIYSNDIKAQNKAWWQEFTAAIMAEHPDAYLIGEVWEKNPDNMQIFIEEGGLQSIFNFNLASKLLEAAANESTAYNEADHRDEPLTDAGSTDLNIAEDLAELYYQYGEASGGNFVDCTFLSNHDQARVATVVEDENHCRTAAAMLLTLPGNPYIYYGEEIGVEGPLPDTNVREPMPWYENPFKKNEDGSFVTVGEGWWNVRPVANGEGMSTWRVPNYALGGENSVEAQYDDENSLFSFYQELIYARTNIPALKDGGIGVFEVGGQNMVSYVRVTETSRVLVMVNLTGETITETVPASDTYGEFIRTVFTSSQDSISSFDGETVTIAPYSVIVVE